MLARIWTWYGSLRVPVRLGLVLFALAFVFAVSQLFVLAPQRREREALRSQLDQLQSQQAQKAKLQATIADRKKEIETIEQDLAGALEKLPDEKEIPQLLLKASSLAREAGLDVTLFRQRPEIFREFYMEVPVDMSTRTDYHQLRKYFFSLGQMPRIVNVTNMTIGNPDPGGNLTSLQASFLLTTYRFLSEAERVALKKAQAKAKP